MDRRQVVKLMAAAPALAALPKAGFARPHCRLGFALAAGSASG